MITKKDICKLESLLYLLAVSQNTSKRKVSEIMNTSVDTLNKYLTDLEAEIGIKLLASNGRGSIITPEAQKIIELSRELENTIKILDTYAKNKSNISGTVRLGLTEGINSCIHPEEIINFYEQYPDLTLEVIITDNNPNLNIFEADVAVTYEIPQGNDLVILLSKQIECGLFASKDFIDRYGFPQSIADMLEHYRICLRMNHQILIPGWKEMAKKARHIPLITNTSHSLIAQVCYGAGIGIIPNKAAPKELVKLDSLDYTPVINVYLVVHKDTKDSPKIRVLIDYMQRIMNNL